MRVTRVQSSMIHLISYREKAKSLRIVFKDGSVYYFLPVEKWQVEVLMSVESKGKYFRQHIMGNPKILSFKAKDGKRSAKSSQ